MRHSLRALFALFVLVALAAPVAAQPAPPPTEIIVAVPDAPAVARAVGWYPVLKAAATFSFNHNQDVVGTPDGVSWLLGAIINGGLDYVAKGGHFWLNTLKWELSFSKTPLLDEMVKSLDSFEFESTYLYQIPNMTWWGPYGNVKVKTALLPGYLLFQSPTSVATLGSDGALVGDISRPRSRLNLTDSFAPTTLRESVGLWADPVRTPAYTLQTRLGVGAWEFFTRNGLNLADDAATPEFEVKQMQDMVQLGGEVRIVMKGLYKALINYQAKAEFMVPFYSSFIPTNKDGSDMAGLELMNTEFEFLLGFKLASWASLDYTMKAYRLPPLSPDWQIQNGLLLTLTANIVGK
ncbi:MAG: DUF3078 domain-containing protein [Pseudomonadota bacterium]